MFADWHEPRNIANPGVVGDPNLALVNRDQVEGVLQTLAPTSPTRRGRPALRDDDASAPQVTGTEIERVPDIGSLHVPREDEIDAQARETLRHDPEVGVKVSEYQKLFSEIFGRKLS